jgi:D-alanyl-D-alanine carboxypeptidase
MDTLARRLPLVLAFSVGCGAPEPQGELPPVEDLARVQQRWVECVRQTDTGYIDGVPFEITVVTADDKPVEVTTANAYAVMQEAAAADGVSITVVSGFRTYAEQEYLYNCYINCNCNNCNLAAAPGYSNHQSGHALDLNTSSGGVLAWMNAHGADYGFERTVPTEDWHWEWWGGGPGGGPCDETGAGTPCTVDTTGLTGTCMDSGKCASLGGDSTSGYCPGPSNYQCCTSMDPPVEDAGVPDAGGTAGQGGAGGAAGSAGEPGGGAAGEGGVAGAAGAAGAFDAGSDSDGAPGGSGLYYASSEEPDGCACDVAGAPTSGRWGWVAWLCAVGAAVVLRRGRGSAPGGANTHTHCSASEGPIRRFL